MTLAKVVLFSSLISATMIVWYEAVGMGFVFVAAAIILFSMFVIGRRHKDVR